MKVYTDHFEPDADKKVNGESLKGGPGGGRGSRGRGRGRGGRGATPLGRKQVPDSVAGKILL